MADLSNQIESIAAEPASGAVDGMQAANQPLPHLIEADKHLQSSVAANQSGVGCSNNGRRGFLFSKIRPPGSV